MATDQKTNHTDSTDADTIAPWHGIAVGRHQIPPAEFSDYRTSQCVIDVHLSHPYQLEWKRSGRYQRVQMTPSAICVTPVDEPISLRWNENLEIIKAYLSHTLLTTTAESLKLRGEIIIPERHGDFDTQITHLCQALWAEAQAGYPLGRVFGESLGTALASCLLQRYCHVSSTSSTPGKLPPRVWKALQTFIEDQLHEDISLEDMAQVARLSPYHFSRCFKETTGTSPHQYLIARRVEHARNLLTHSDLSLAQIAVQSGFSDQSHLTRHMKRILGQTPNTLLPRSPRPKHT